MAANKQRDISKALLKWINDKEEDFSMYSLVGADVVVKIFNYVPPETKTSKKLIDLEGKSLSSTLGTVTLPIGKVLCMPDDAGKKDSIPVGLVEGDIVSLPENIVVSVMNPQWIEYQELMKERPAPSSPPPPMYVSKLAEWARYVFVRNKWKLDAMKEKDYTFLIPAAFIRTIIDKEKLAKALYDEVK